MVKQMINVLKIDWTGRNDTKIMKNVTKSTQSESKLVEERKENFKCRIFYEAIQRIRSRFSFLIHLIYLFYLQ